MTTRTRRRVVVISGTAQLLMLPPMLRLERRMKRTGGPGIIPFELAGSPELARRIMIRWGEDGRALGVLGGRAERLAPVARAFATAKFALLTAGWLYGALGLAGHLTRR